ncbi:f6fcdea5-4bee-4143-999a-c2e294f887d1 [Sclerotinia trifoliorum]|uniref:F6fcdea5-4bee-4143-999a-c2e294f887d1 n=1 Tax=Sclerotinia trifoliorum TaxID=28548 RepID=A0A8H2VLW8_9HELO|nr:f6fcdea5-4bee-4143-999a-c2e294f887d1 [Sclerotinia trifoliorum]
MANKNMSQESAAEQERQEVLALLHSTTGSRSRGSVSSTGSGHRIGCGRSKSPFTANPRSPVRSMLDVDGAPAMPRHSSIGGTSSGIPVPIRSMLDVDTPLPAAPAVRSMLDISTPATKSFGSRSAQTSPTINPKAHASNARHSRSSSDAAAKPTVNFGPRAITRVDPNEYQFSGYLPSNPGGPSVPKRNTQAGKRITSSMAEVVRSGVDLSGFKGGRDRGRHNSIASTGISTTKSKSPHNRFSPRSSSPVSADPSKYAVLDNGKIIDVNSAYQRLSDANLARSNGELSSLSQKNRQNRAKNEDFDINGARLKKDYVPMEGEEGIIDSTDESDDEESRGRQKRARSVDGDDSEVEKTTLGMGRAKGPRTPLSQMAAAEAERQDVAAKEALNEKYKVKSLLDPQIILTGPAGLKANKPVVHPHTSFDPDGSGDPSPHDSDTEADRGDVKKAQSLSLTMSAIKSTPITSRCVRTIHRGDFKKVQQEARDNQRRTRKYLVATDLSDEAAHALEWTIGTVLRDGDTMLAIYCVDEELGIITPENSGDDVQIKQQISAIAAAQRSARVSRVNTPLLTPSIGPIPLNHNFRLDSGSRAPSPMGRDSRSKAEQDRFRAVEDITDRVSELLRKTKLQVQVNIEVLHCKNPKHLITEVIDYINPTLVILGSRGRSALKGVILGSFSNYLVTKSSVPVMVARKRLRKHNKQKRTPNIRLANNLTNPIVKSLASAKID